MNEIIFNQHPSSATNDTKDLAGRLKSRWQPWRDKQYIMAPRPRRPALLNSSAPHVQLTAAVFDDDYDDDGDAGTSTDPSSRNAGEQSTRLPKTLGYLDGLYTGSSRHKLMSLQMPLNAE